MTERDQIDTLAHMYMIAHFSGLVQEPNRVTGLSYLYGPINHLETCLRIIVNLK